MANEVLMTFSLTYDDSEEASNDAFLQLAEVYANVTTKRYIRGKMNVAITEEVIPLGDLGSVGYAAFMNLDATNYLHIKTGTGGTNMVKIPPGKGAMFHFGSGVTAPFAIADTATCQMAYLICSL